MAEYTMTLQNASSKPWHLAIYKRFPHSPGLSSIAWQVMGLPAQNVGTPPAEGTVRWSMKFGTVITDFNDMNSSFTGRAYATASLGEMYRVISTDGIPAISPVPVGSTAQGQIILTNATNPATAVGMGFTLSDNIVAVEPNVGGNLSTLFRVHPAFYVAGYRNIKIGQLVDEDVSTPPIEVKYADGVFHHTVKVVEYAGNTRLELVN